MQLSSVLNEFTFFAVLANSEDFTKTLFEGIISKRYGDCSFVYLSCPLEGLIIKISPFLSMANCCSAWLKCSKLNFA